MKMAYDHGCRSSAKFASPATILSICLLGVIGLVSSLSTERRSESSSLDQDDAVETPQKDARAEFTGSADFSLRVNRAKRDSLFMERTIFFNNGDDDDNDNDVEEEEEEKEVRQEKQEKQEKQDQDKEEEGALRMGDDGKIADAGKHVKQSNVLRKDTELTLSERETDTEGKRNPGRFTSDGSPSAQFNPLVGFIQHSRDFLIHFLDIENILGVFVDMPGFHSYEGLTTANEKPDKWSKRRAFLNAWLKEASKRDWVTYYMYHLLQLYRPGLFPEVSLETVYTDRIRNVLRSQVAPPDGKQSSSCRLHVLHDILEHKTHFIEKMENSTSQLEHFFSAVTRKFTSEVDEVRKSVLVNKNWEPLSSAQQKVLRNGFWLHCLDYASEEQKFEFVQLAKEGQPQLFSGNPLSELMAKLESTSPYEVCQPEESSNSPSVPDVSVFNGEVSEAIVWAKLTREYDDSGAEVYGLEIGWRLATSKNGHWQKKELTTLPFFSTIAIMDVRTVTEVSGEYDEAYKNNSSYPNCQFLTAIDSDDVTNDGSSLYYKAKKIEQGKVYITLIQRWGKKRVFLLRYKDDVDSNATTWEQVKEYY